MAGGGKAERHGELVLTDKGFKKIEDIKVGDIVITPKNTKETVESVWPQGLVDIYQVTFQDGRTIDCCGNHLWQMHIAGKPGEKVADTKQLKVIVDRENLKGKGVRTKLPITPLAAPLDLPATEKLPMPPYVLGAILGDGYIRDDASADLTSMDAHITDRISSCGYNVGKGVGKGVNKAKSYHISPIREAIRGLKLEGTRSFTKFVPEMYKQSSIQDRFDLIQGLMDTDGYVSKDGKTYYYTVSPQLAGGVKDILFSLGFTVTTTSKVGKYKKDGETIACQVVYTLYIRGANQDKLFSLPRKVERCKPKNVGNKIVDIKLVGKDYATCIGISGWDKLYVTTNFIVTHNSRICLTKNLDSLHDPNFRCTIFRRSAPELLRQGALIDESKNIYPDFKGKWGIQKKTWQFPSGASIAFSAIASDDDLGSWQGSQLSRIFIDEAGDKWTEKQVLFLLSRLRASHSLAHPQLIMTCNPDIDSFLKGWVDFSLDEHTGVPVAGTEDRIRWMITLDNKVYWADSAQESFEIHGKPRGMVYARGMEANEIIKHPPDKLFIPKSFRFIPTGVFDNPYLLPPRNNSYLANLLAQPYVNQLKFLHGSWTARESGSTYFQRAWTPIVPFPPADASARVRAWDFAASEKTSSTDPDYSVGIKMSRDRMGVYYVEDMVRFQARTDKVLKTVIEVGRQDGEEDCQISIPTDPAAAGKTAAKHYVTILAEHGIYAKPMPPNNKSSKLTRFKPLCALAEAGSLRIVEGDWNEAFFLELESFTGEKSTRKLHDDIVDATTDAFTVIARKSNIPTFAITSLTQQSPIPTL